MVRSQEPIRTSPANKRAPEDQELLIDALEKFVNLGNSLDEYRDFGATHPAFFPVIVWDTSTGSLAWDPACHLVALYYRDELRKVWSGPYRNEALKVLLGLSSPFHELAQSPAEEPKSDLELAGMAGLRELYGPSEDSRRR